MVRSVVGFLLLLTAAAVAPGQSRVSGTVTIQEENAPPAPVADVTIVARSDPRGLPIAAAETDSQGRYLLEGLPAGSVTLSLDSQSYFVLTAGGVESESIARSCPESGDCPETDFELARTGVIEGWLTDSFGDPLQEAVVDVIPLNASEHLRLPGRGRGRIPNAQSDDRGYFRVWGLPPGRYKLTASDMRSRFGRGRPGALAEQEVEVAGGGTTSQVRLAATGVESRTYTVSGRLIGVDSAPGINRRVMAEGASSLPGFGPSSAVRDGAFQIPELAAGRYLFRLMSIREGRREMRLLGEVEVDRDITDLTLSPQPPTGVRGRVLFVDSPPGRFPLWLESAGQSSEKRERLRAEPPDHTFENAAVRPGRWEALVFGDYYLVEPVSIDVAPGQMTEVEIQVSNQRSQVAGVARLRGGASRAAAAHFVVAVRGPRGAERIQADDDGRFVFDRLIPGDYEIAAWSDQDVDVNSNQAWEEAGDNRKTINVEAGFEMEVDLTVTP